MSDQYPTNREEALRAEAQAYLEQLQRKAMQLQSERERMEEALQEREEGAARQAKEYLSDLSERARFRAKVRERAEARKREQEELRKREALAYRLRLRGYMDPEQCDGGIEELLAEMQAEEPEQDK